MASGRARTLGHGENVTGTGNDPRPYRYRIRVRGHLGETIRSAFPALQARTSGGDTVLTGPLPDRAALYGVLAQIEALGLELLEVRRLPPALCPRPGPPARPVPSSASAAGRGAAADSGTALIASVA